MSHDPLVEHIVAAQASMGVRGSGPRTSPEVVSMVAHALTAAHAEADAAQTLALVVNLVHHVDAQGEPEHAYVAVACLGILLDRLEADAAVVAPCLSALRACRRILDRGADARMRAFVVTCVAHVYAVHADVQRAVVLEWLLLHARDNDVLTGPWFAAVVRHIAGAREEPCLDDELRLLYHALMEHFQAASVTSKARASICGMVSAFFPAAQQCVPRLECRAAVAQWGQVAWATAVAVMGPYATGAADSHIVVHSAEEAQLADALLLCACMMPAWLPYADHVPCGELDAAIEAEIDAETASQAPSRRLKRKKARIARRAAQASRCEQQRGNGAPEAAQDDGDADDDDDGTAEAGAPVPMVPVHKAPELWCAIREGLFNESGRPLYTCALAVLKHVVQCLAAYCSHVEALPAHARPLLHVSLGETGGHFEWDPARSEALAATWSSYIHFTVQMGERVAHLVLDGLTVLRRVAPRGGPDGDGVPPTWIQVVYEALFSCVASRSVSVRHLMDEVFHFEAQPALPSGPGQGSPASPPYSPFVWATGDWVLEQLLPPMLGTPMFTSVLGMHFPTALVRFLHTYMDALAPQQRMPWLRQLLRAATGALRGSLRNNHRALQAILTFVAGLGVSPGDAGVPQGWDHALGTLCGADDDAPPYVLGVPLFTDAEDVHVFKELYKLIALHSRANRSALASLLFIILLRHTTAARLEEGDVCCILSEFPFNVILPRKKPNASLRAHALQHWLGSAPGDAGAASFAARFVPWAQQQLVACRTAVEACGARADNDLAALGNTLRMHVLDPLLYVDGTTRDNVLDIFFSFSTSTPITFEDAWTWSMLVDADYDMHELGLQHVLRRRGAQLLAENVGQAHADSVTNVVQQLSPETALDDLFLYREVLRRRVHTMVTCAAVHMQQGKVGEAAAFLGSWMTHMAHTWLPASAAQAMVAMRALHMMSDACHLLSVPALAAEPAWNHAMQQLRGTIVRLSSATAPMCDVTGVGMLHAYEIARWQVLTNTIRLQPAHACIAAGSSEGEGEGEVGDGIVATVLSEALKTLSSPSKHLVPTVLVSLVNVMCHVNASHVAAVLRLLGLAWTYLTARRQRKDTRAHPKRLAAWIRVAFHPHFLCCLWEAHGDQALEPGAGGGNHVAWLAVLAEWESRYVSTIGTLDVVGRIFDAVWCDTAPDARTTGDPCSPEQHALRGLSAERRHVVRQALLQGAFVPLWSHLATHGSGRAGLDRFVVYHTSIGDYKVRASAEQESGEVPMLSNDAELWVPACELPNEGEDADADGDDADAADDGGDAKADDDVVDSRCFKSHMLQRLPPAEKAVKTRVRCLLRLSKLLLGDSASGDYSAACAALVTRLIRHWSAIVPTGDPYQLQWHTTQLTCLRIRQLQAMQALTRHVATEADAVQVLETLWPVFRQRGTNYMYLQVEHVLSVLTVRHPSVGLPMLVRFVCDLDEHPSVLRAAVAIVTIVLQNWTPPPEYEGEVAKVWSRLTTLCVSHVHGLRACAQRALITLHTCVLRGQLTLPKELQPYMGMLIEGILRSASDKPGKYGIVDQWPLQCSLTASQSLWHVLYVGPLQPLTHTGEHVGPSVLRDMAAEMGYELNTTMEEAAQYWLAQSNLVNMVELVESARASKSNRIGDEEGPVQRKAIPESVVHIHQEEQRFAMLNRPRQSVIVCASLVDRLPNLGGLARTCEIFNAEALILPAARVRDAKSFQNTAVNADQWVPLIEVKPSELKAWLLEQKALGYSVVGLEQSSISKPLHQFRFPSKCILLLGNERTGMPQELLPMLDLCVEIPQLGLTRSLNVHVSGAIMLWEATRQLALGDSAGIGQTV